MKPETIHSLYGALRPGTCLKCIEEDNSNNRTTKILLVIDKKQGLIMTMITNDKLKGE